MLNLDPTILGNDRNRSVLPTVGNTYEYNLFCQKYWYRSMAEFVELVEKYGSQQLTKHITKPILLSAAVDPWDLEWVHQYLYQQNLLDKITAVLTSDLPLVESGKYSVFKFFPVLVYRFHCQWASVKHSVNFENRTHNLVCLNRSPELHRALVFYQLSQLPWFNQIKFSFFGMHSYGVENMPNKSCKDDFVQLLGDSGAQWLDTTTFPVSIPGDTAWKDMDVLGCHSPYTPLYCDSYANLCTESSVNALLITEKSMKSIAAGNLLWMIASTNHMAVLAKLGFDLYSPETDYTLYDNIENNARNPMDRIAGCINNLSRHYYQIPNIWNANKQKLINNRSWLFSPDFATNLKSYINDLL